MLPVEMVEEPFFKFSDAAGQLVFDVVLALKEIAVGQTLQLADNSIVEIVDAALCDKRGVKFSVAPVNAEGIFCGDAYWLDEPPENLGVSNDLVSFSRDSDHGDAPYLFPAKLGIILRVVADYADDGAEYVW